MTDEYQRSLLRVTEAALAIRILERNGCAVSKRPADVAFPYVVDGVLASRAELLRRAKAFPRSARLLKPRQ